MGPILFGRTVRAGVCGLLALCSVAAFPGAGVPQTGSVADAVSSPERPGGGLQVRTHRKHYDVSGRTAEEVLSSLRKSARTLGGEMAFAWMETRTEYRYRSVPGGTACRLKEVEVLVHATISLPRWTPRSASWKLRNQWNAFLGALERHEDGHVRLARRGGERLLAALRALRTPSCDVIGGRAREEADRILEDLDREQRRYDRETGNGRTQGVVWKVTVDGRSEPR